MEEVKAVSILHRNKTSGWFGTDYNMNLTGAAATAAYTATAEATATASATLIR